MPSSKPTRIFISYAHKDGAYLARRLHSDLANEGFGVWLDKPRLRGGAVWSREIDREIDTCEIMLALLSPGSYESRVCTGEQLRALDKGKRLIPVIAVKGADRPVYLYASQCRDFSVGTHYKTYLDQLIADIRGDPTASLPESYRQTRVTYLTAPPRVTNYLERPEALRTLRDAVFAEDHRQPIALTALAGMGGIGKTVLAKALTEDEVVQRAFPDGIVWVTAGKERKRDFIEEMHEVAKALGDDLSGYDTPLACENQYRSTIANKAALIVVDDVWSKADIEPLLAESPRSRFLFTTRDAAIGRFVGAHEHRADLLDLEQSRELLASWAGVPVAKMPAAADKVIDECGRLPLALSVVGGMLRDTNDEFWSDTLDLLRKADVSAIQDQLPEGQESFFKAVEVSVQSLKPEMRERYKELAVLLEDMAAPLSVLKTIWNLGEPEARRLSRLFIDRSLALDDDTGEGIRLHDLQLDYICAQYSDREALDLIHGAVRLSSHVISRDPVQFTSQMVGRLLPHHGVPAIKKFTARLAEGASRPWLRSLQAALHPPGTSLIRTLEGHLDSVVGVALSADGRHAVSASEDRTVKVWDLETGRALRTLEGHLNSVVGVALSADGRRAISASSDQTLKVWDLETGRAVRTLKGHTAAVPGVALSTDGRRAISASDDQTLKVWDLETGRARRTLKGHRGHVNGVAVSPDGRHAVSASSDNTLKVWDLETGRELRTLKGHRDHVNGVAVSPDGRRAVSASSDKTLKLWDLETGRELRTLEGHSDRVMGVAMSADGRRAVSASWDRTLKVWDMETGRALRTLEGHSEKVIGVAVSADGLRAVSASWDDTLKVWDLKSGRELHSLEIHLLDISGVAASMDGRFAISASWDQTLKVWDLETGRALRTLEGHSDRVMGVAMSADGRRAVSASDDQTLKVWDLETGRAVRTLKGHTAGVLGVAVSADGRHAVSGSWDKTVKVWDLETGRALRTLEGHSEHVIGVAISADGRRAVSASRDGVKVWDTETGRAVRTLEGHSDLVYAVTVSADGRHAISGSWDKTVKVWDLETGRALRTLEGHSEHVIGVAVSAAGRRVGSASTDRTLRVWDLDTGLPLATLTCDDEVTSCKFIGNDNLVAGDAGGRVHFLRLDVPKSQRLNSAS